MAVEDADGTPVWGERFSRDVLDDIQRAQGNRIYETQYLNRPRATEDIVFQRSYVNIHQSITEYPMGMTNRTIVDLSGWGDSKGTARTVVLTAGRDSKNHIWVTRLDVARMNPSEVIDKYIAHAKQFNSTVFIEEVQYQRAVRFFAKQVMEATGDFIRQEQLPFDGRRDAKNLRIRSLEPIVTNGALHILSHMTELLEELEFYPHGKTVDILDCLGYLLRVARKPDEATQSALSNPFSMEVIEDELKRKNRNSMGLPFDFQLRPVGNLYGKH
jgi:hypothetical protein